MIKRFAFAAALVAIASLVPACSTNVQGDDASPVYLTVQFDGVLVLKNVATLTPLQVNSTTVHNVIKAPGNGSSSFLDVKLDDYVVTWRRLDGGTIVPEPETFAVGTGAIVPAGGTSTLTNQVYLSLTEIQRSPLDRLFPFNGGVDLETGKAEIRMVAIVTVRGHTLSGQPATGAGTFNTDFVYVPLTGKAASK
jgi:hypothetical protein